MLRVKNDDGMMQVTVLPETSHLQRNDFVNATMSRTRSGELRITGDKVDVFDIEELMCPWKKLVFPKGVRYSRLRMAAAHLIEGFDVPEDDYDTHLFGVISRTGAWDSPARVRPITKDDIVDSFWRNWWAIQRYTKFERCEAIELIEFKPHVRPHYSRIKTKGVSIASNVYIIHGFQHLPNQDILLG